MVSTITAASALIRQGDQILLVYQQRTQDAYPTWGLPGGKLEEYETLADGLLREVQEETGLLVEKIGALVSVAHLISKSEELQVVAFLFEVAQWSGTPAPGDPDGVVTDAQFFPVEEAITLMGRASWRDTFEPAIAYLRGERAAGTVWLYEDNDAKGRVL